MTELNIGTIYVCRIKKTLQHGVIVDLGDGKEGFIHISELSKRWVKDIKDVAKEGDQIVCKLIKLEPQSIELSAKRVTDNEKRAALREWSIENRINKILEKSLGNDAVQIKSKIKEKYGSNYELYNTIIKNGEHVLSELKLNKVAVDALKDFVEKTKKKITIKTDLIIQDFSDNGVDNIKKLLLESYPSKNSYSVKYIKAPHYLLTVNAGETKKTIIENKKIIEAMESKSKELGIDFKYKEIKE
jgi:translation initiation factor 2 alpha subunit (eIF-2alpha)